MKSMKSTAVLIFTVAAWAVAPALFAEDKPAAAPAPAAAAPAAAAPAAAAEKPADKPAEEAKKPADTKSPPSKEAEAAAKEADKAAGAFDPQTYTCKGFLDDMKKPDGGMAPIAVIWAHGYESALYGTDQVGPLNEKSIAEIAQAFAEMCAEDPASTFARAAKAMSEED